MHTDYAKIILAIADSLRAAAAAEPLPPVPPLAEPLPPVLSEQVQQVAATQVADAIVADERENLLDRAVDRLVDNEQVRNAVVARAAEQVDHDAVAQAVADKVDECDILDRIDFDQMADNLKDTIDEGAVIDAAAEQIAGQICFDKVVAAAAQKLAEQIMARLLRA